MATIPHVRVGVKTSGRRINDRGSPGVTLCGAPLTDRDMCSEQDARRSYAAGWKICPACLVKMGYPHTFL